MFRDKKRLWEKNMECQIEAIKPEENDVLLIRCDSWVEHDWSRIRELAKPFKVKDVVLMNKNVLIDQYTYDGAIEEIEKILKDLKDKRSE